MPRLPGVNHKRAVKAFKKVGFEIIRESSHIIMSDGDRIISIPRNNPIDPITMGGIIKDAGLTIDRFKSLL